MDKHWLVFKNRCLGLHVKCLSQYTILCIVFILKGLVEFHVLNVHSFVFA